MEMIRRKDLCGVLTSCMKVIDHDPFIAKHIRLIKVGHFFYVTTAPDPLRCSSFDYSKAGIAVSA